jgi:hypothetical protein
MTNHEVLLIREQIIEVELISLSARRKVLKDQSMMVEAGMYSTMAEYELPRVDYQIGELENELKEVKRRIFKGTL